MTVSTPNTSTSGTVGTPSPAAVATESADSSVTPAGTDHVQQMSLVNIAGQMRNALNLLAQALSLAWDPASGRLRILIDPAGGGQTLGTVSSVTTVATITKLNQLGSGGVDASTTVYDNMQQAWAASVLPTIARV